MCSQTLTAQVFGGNPSSLKWKQINTDSFRIIFPKGLDSTALNVASLVQFQQRNIAKTMGAKQRKVNIVLQNQITYSNGYVGLAPFRSEFYLMPPMDVTQLGAQNWADNLAIHEYRHVEQYNNFDVGLSHAFKIVFGENGQAFANALAVPDWFFEGDAVYNETLLSKQGRGRVPYFMNAFKALYLGDKHYNYQKIRNGSYVDYVPNWYNLGYILVDYGYQKYGTDFWKNVTHDAAAFKGLFYPLQKGIKKYSGLSFNDFKDSAFNYYQQQWAKEPKDSLQYLTKTEKKNVVSYQYPYPTGNGNIIALKSDYKHVSMFVKLKNGVEKAIAVRPISNDDYFSYNNGKIIYSKLKPNVRWGYKESSDIELFDIDTKQKTTITHNQRYFTPDISHNGKLIAAVSFTTNQQSSIDLLDLKGNIIKHISAQQNHVYSYPKFSDDDKSVFVVERNKVGEMAIQQFDVASGDEKNIRPFGNRLIGFPVVQNDTLFFTCSSNGYDASWAYVSAENKVYRLAKTQLGIYQSFIKNDTLVGSVFSADGYRLAKIKSFFQPVENLEADTLVRLYHDAPKHDYSYVLANIDSTNYTITNYPKLHHPINFHSLQPDFEDPNYNFTLYGENVLNTLQTNVSYTYNRIENYHEVGVGSVYGGSFIEPFINGNYIFDRTAYSTKGKQNVHFSDAGWQFGLQLPLNFSSGNFYKFFTYTTSFNQRFIHWNENNLDLKNRSANYLSNQISFVNQSQQALQQMYLRFAQSISTLLRNTIDNNSAWQILIKGSFYFPAILPTHSFHVDLAWQKQDTLSRYAFSYNFPFSRGYDLYNFPEMWKFGLNYTLPVISPDAGFGNLIYLKRIRANVFYDNTFGKIPQEKTTNFASFGAEVSFDLNVWNQQSTGFIIRYSRLLNNQILSSRNRWEVILPVNLF
ncbi:TolB family protein [Arachidicoccus ginsenosidimutans]|uniref:TolB family protein n=1 Tax=Arachidicoccus sp. BS20 TaxID=1850526 RepID=UPI0012E81F4A|nr:hypothetical protein [Arachidicoccus sp. BS20]